VIHGQLKTAYQQRFGELNGNSVLTERDVAKIREGLADGRSTYQLAYEFQCSQSTIMMIKQGKTWPPAST
jgi:hypothetical protein